MTRTLILLLSTFWAVTVASQTPVAQQPLPALAIEQRGELIMEQGEFSYRPWSSELLPGKVHILQYFPATMGDSKTFAPFTDKLQETFALGEYHVTTIINLDAALWGTTGFVVSELEDSKRKFPRSTMVIDAEGSGISGWSLDDTGMALVITDPAGVVQYVSRQALSEAEISASIELVRSFIEES